MYDSVGKFGIDQLNRASDDGKRCVEQAEQAKAFPGHRVSCQETQRICLYCAQKLVLHHWLVPLSLCPVVRTKFPNRVMYRGHRRCIGLAGFSASRSILLICIIGLLESTVT